MILIRSNEANPDPRLQKYINYLERQGKPYKVIAWNREGNKSVNPNYIYYEKKASYGQGVKNIPNKLGWFLFVIKELILNKKYYKVIHACDFDTMLPAYVVSKLVKKKLIFDVFDWMSKDNSKSILMKSISSCENYLFRKTNYAILCEEYRINQINEASRRAYMVLPNIPDITFEMDWVLRDEIQDQRRSYKIILSYVGVFDTNRGIEDLLKYISLNPTYCINIAGFGVLNSLVEKYSREYENVIFWGKVDYNKGLNIMKNSDMILAFYYLTNSVHKFAAPNKFYESLFLQIPIITNDETALAQMVREYNVGVVIEEGFRSMSRFFDNQHALYNYEEIKKNQKLIWETKYQYYTYKFMEEKYAEIVN